MALRSLTDHFDEGKSSGSPVRRTDSPSKKKGAGTADLPERTKSGRGDAVVGVGDNLPASLKSQLQRDLTNVSDLVLPEKRSRHLGTDGVYLDDITELEPEVAALYFPKRFVHIDTVLVLAPRQTVFERIQSRPRSLTMC